jgi:hypothetical protein
MASVGDLFGSRIYTVGRDQEVTLQIDQEVPR